MRLVDLTGMRFGMLTVMRRAPSSSRYVNWECVCDCGTTKTIAGQSLKSGATKSCECQKANNPGRPPRHGRSNKGDITYQTWMSMMQRCTDEKHISYPRYGGRGIGVCERWKSFEAFLADMGERPSPQHSIDRINNEFGYSKENCRWATSKEQAQNKRKK